MLVVCENNPERSTPATAPTARPQTTTSLAHPIEVGAFSVRVQFEPFCLRLGEAFDTEATDLEIARAFARSSTDPYVRKPGRGAIAAALVYPHCCYCFCCCCRCCCSCCCFWCRRFWWCCCTSGVDSWRSVAAAVAAAAFGVPIIPRGKAALTSPIRQIAIRIPSRVVCDLAQAGLSLPWSELSFTCTIYMWTNFQIRET